MYKFTYEILVVKLFIFGWNDGNKIFSSTYFIVILSVQTQKQLLVIEGNIKNEIINTIKKSTVKADQNSSHIWMYVRLMFL